MKRLIALLGLVFVFVSLIAVPALAQATKPNPTIPYGLAAKDQVQELTVAIQHLRLPPLAKNTCSLYERYEVAEIMDDYLWKYYAPEVMDKLKITHPEVKKLRAATARDLAIDLTRQLRDSQTPHGDCFYRVPESVSEWGGFVTHLRFNDKYQLKGEIADLEDLAQNELQEYDKDLATLEELQTAVLQYAEEHGPELVGTYLTDPKAEQGPSYDAGVVLWELVMKERLAPSVIKEFDEAVLWQLLEFRGTRPRHETETTPKR